jgi:non-heme chloroperoxidase
MFFLASRGYRCIARDRRGHGRSSQPWNGYDYNTFADDLATLIETLDLKDAILVGHPMGGGEIARYIGRRGSKRVAKAVLIAAIPPLTLKTEANPDGLPIEAFDGIRAGVLATVADGASDLFAQLFGTETGHARMVSGVISLPKDTPVVVETIFETT